MGTATPAPRSGHPEGKKNGVRWPAIALVAVMAALILVAARDYLKAQKKPSAPVVQSTAAVVHIHPTVAPAPTPVPTVDPEREQPKQSPRMRAARKDRHET